MRTTRAATQALRLAAEPTRQPYVCRSCLLQASRQFHTSPPTRAEGGSSWWNSMQKSIFGDKKSKKAEESREAKRKQRIEDLATKEKGVLETKTDRFGNNFEVAEVVDPTTHKEYIVSSTWDGMESVGSEEWVRKRADRGEVYNGFMPRQQVELTNSQLYKLLHHIAVEVLALEAAGRDVMEICNARSGETAQHTANLSILVENGVVTGLAPLKEAEGEAIAAAVGETAEDAQPVNEAAQDTTDVSTQAENEIQTGLENRGASNVEAILAAISETTEDSQPVNEESLLLEIQQVTSSELELTGKSGRAWTGLKLQDPEIKLAILKRAMQLTGKRFPDPAISNATTVSGLYDVMKMKEKPKKLADAPQWQKLSDMGNVKMHATRRTSVHKDQAVGRWKLIEDELAMRGLPAFGTRSSNDKPISP